MTRVNSGWPGQPYPPPAETDAGPHSRQGYALDPARIWFKLQAPSIVLPFDKILLDCVIGFFKFSSSVQRSASSTAGAD